jgi:polyhydroxyalkanoate synthesis regulator phasin
VIAAVPVGRTARTAALANLPAAYNPDMDGNGTAEPRSLEQLLLAGLGWASLTIDAANDVADDLARRVGIERDEMRNAVRDAVASWRAEAERLGTLPSEASEKAFQRLGLVRREEAEDLALRVAQLEHRVRLLEKQSE